MPVGAGRENAPNAEELTRRFKSAEQATSDRAQEVTLYIEWLEAELRVAVELRARYAKAQEALGGPAAPQRQ